MTKTISILGCTGSIGRQTLDVVRARELKVAALTCWSNVDLMEEQCREFQPALAVMGTEPLAEELRLRLSDLSVEVRSGKEAMVEAASMAEADTVLVAIVGLAALEPTIAAIRSGKRIGLANKETLVCAGTMIMEMSERYQAEIIPVDSEHSAIFQCLMGCEDRKEIRKLILTASGGAFYAWNREQLLTAKKEDALRHPNWKMGPKITVDCATMLNKGLELIEAMRLYHMPEDKVEIVVHRQSIIHSLVEFCDGAVMAQLGVPDMRIPIQLAMTYPNRVPSPAADLNLLTCGPLTFEAPDLECFPCLGLAREAAKVGGTACVTLNGANEEAVAAYLRDQIGFYDISDCISYALEKNSATAADSLETVLAADRQARAAVKQYFHRLGKVI